MSLPSEGFPIAADDLTPAFVGRALGTAVEHIELERIGADRGMLGELFLVTPTYGAGGVGPTAIVAKFAALRDGALDSARRGGTHERELRCYGELLPDTPVATPELHGAWYNPDTAHFLLLQGAIAVDGSVDQIRGISVDQARMVLKEVARLHARWWQHGPLSDCSWLPRLDAPQRINNLTHLAMTGWPLLVDLMGADLAAADRVFGEELPNRLADALGQLASLPATLLHCDLRADNILFDPGGDAVTLIDWQGAGTGPVAFDLAYFLVQSLTVADRRTHESALLDFYRRELEHAGVSLTAREVRSGWGSALNYGLVIGCAVPLISDPDEPRVATLARTIARRTLAALSDERARARDEEEKP